eukprot:CAMPEP_0194271530 /NCGR_PEP_ID=MMETSP0169-20130528/5273_1 /TAXON_ID=218684 /ORGANISM="Corethron pennatum, Strain L29A3" /LENGTH=821 /DNA_ID=CAMNT_0039013893 /DNA_START=18 /DNA_END=2483 /DNA_ORIENTATION=-
MKFQKIPVLLKILCVSSLPHPSGAAIHNGYEYYFDENLLTWQEHEDAAVAGGYGHLVSITSSEEDAYVAQLAGNKHIWIGGERTTPNGSAHDFRWTDGTPWGGFTDWYGTTEPNNYYFPTTGKYEECVEKAWDYGNEGPHMYHKWNDARCELQRAAVYKKPYGPSVVHNGFVYYRNTDLLTWQQHEDAAVAGGHGHLASVTSSEEDAFVAQLAGPRSFWIGGENTGNGNANFLWTDGTPWGGFTNWLVNEPSYTYNGITENCVENASWADHDWNDADCSMMKAGVYKKPYAPGNGQSGTGCCSQNYKDCGDAWCGSTESSCVSTCPWIPSARSGCVALWITCGANYSPCCDGLTCEYQNEFHSQCAVAPTTAAPDDTGCCSQNYKDCGGAWCGSTESSCLSNCPWIPSPQSECVALWDSCGADYSPCCDGLTCVDHEHHSQCTVSAGPVLTKTPTISAPKTSAPMTSAPTTEFQGQNYTIGFPDISFVDNKDGNFSFFFEYSVGKSAARLELLLFRENCTSTDNVSDVLHIGAEEESGGIYSKEVIVNIGAITGSPLVTTTSQGYSAGILSFCTKARAITSDDISVTFLKSKIGLSYDLTDNNFEVFNNEIKADAVGKSNTTVDTNYGVFACRCTISDYNCDSEPPVLKQNDLIFICLRPDDASRSSTDISNFEMHFFVDGNKKYAASEFGTNGPKVGSLSQITKLDQTHRVVSRLVTSLFEENVDILVVSGFADLVFRTNARRLEFMGHSNLRSAQGSLEDPAGEVPFKMNVVLNKQNVVTGALSTGLTTALTVAVPTVGFCLILLVAFAFYKKENNRKV